MIGTEQKDMNPLHRYVDPATYHSDAVITARQLKVADLGQDMLIVRLCLDLSDRKWGAAAAVLEALASTQPKGYQLFQTKTAKIILALQSGNSVWIEASVQEWLEARRSFPEIFINDVLDDPELASYVAKIDPDLLLPPAIKRPPITKADRALVADLADARRQAVCENLEYLRPLGVTGTIASIARCYHIIYVNRHLREVTLGSRKDWPDLILALDQKGGLRGSFLAH